MNAYQCIFTGLIKNKKKQSMKIDELFIGA